MATHKLKTFNDHILDLQIKQLVDYINELQEQLDDLTDRVTTLEGP